MAAAGRGFYTSLRQLLRFCPFRIPDGVGRYSPSSFLFSSLGYNPRMRQFRAFVGATVCLMATHLTPAHAQSPAADMAKAASAFLATLDEGQAKLAKLPFDSEERFNWFFVPRERVGLPLKKMTAAQRDGARVLLEAGLSEKGYSKAEAIRMLEPVLAVIENNPVRRDLDLYYVTVFGDPSASGTWGWRYEGHHVSLHWTIVAGKSLATTPQFMGSNPAEVRDGPRKGTRVLAAEEDLGRALVQALDGAQRERAVLSAKAPDDILTSNTRKAAVQENRGLPWSAMTTGQRGMLLALIEEYASAMPRPLARERVEKVRSAGLDAVTFAWMGGRERGLPHYYRVQGPTFLIEYDCTQDGANHIHAVWRDFEGDFGVDLLAEHHRNSPHHSGTAGAGR
jgi:hypothetical protein